MTVRTADSKLNTSQSQKTDRLSEHRLCAKVVEQLNGMQRGDAIYITQGTLWVTQEGDPQDYVLSKGESFILNRRGSVVVEALTDASLRFSLN
jgi:hypothetical protein